MIGKFVRIIRSKVRIESTSKKSLGSLFGNLEGRTKEEREIINSI
jgi:hypothetical protein